MRLLRAVLGTEGDVGLTVTRLALGIAIWPHGAQKLLGRFGGYGYRGTMGYFTKTMGFPAPLGFLAIIAEFFGGLGLVLGLFSRVAALGVGSVLAVAAWRVHRPHGFFMNWFGNQEGEGYEYFILGVGSALAVLAKGGGAFSLDRALARDRGGEGRPGGAQAAVGAPPIRMPTPATAGVGVWVCQTRRKDLWVRRRR